MAPASSQKLAVPAGSVAAGRPVGGRGYLDRPWTACPKTSSAEVCHTQRSRLRSCLCMLARWRPGPCAFLARARPSRRRRVASSSTRTRIDGRDVRRRRELRTCPAAACARLEAAFAGRPFSQISLTRLQPNENRQDASSRPGLHQSKRLRARHDAVGGAEMAQPLQLVDKSAACSFQAGKIHGVEPLLWRVAPALRQRGRRRRSV